MDNDTSRTQWCFPAEESALSEIRATIKAALSSDKVDNTEIDAIILAINEACMNVIQHAYCHSDRGNIEISYDYADGKLLIDICDTAKPVDLGSIKGRDLDDIRPGGLGVFFIEQVMDEITYRHRSDCEGNCLSLVKKIR